MSMTCIFANETDTINHRQYESRYYYPDIIRSHAMDVQLDISAQTGSEAGQMAFCLENRSGSTSYFSNIALDYAQPFSTQTTPIRIAGVSGIISVKFRQDIYSDYIEDTNNYLPHYFEIRDDLLHNILAQVPIRPSIADYYDHGYSQPYTELFFDSAISVSGNFYVVFHTPDTINPSQGSMFANTMIYGRTKAQEDRYPLPLMAGLDGIWNPMAEIIYIEDGGIGYYPAFLYLFPILAEDSVSSGIQDPDISEFVHVFPNPTTDIADVNCAYTIETLQVYNSAGALMTNVKPGAHNYRIDLSSYSQGAYIIHIVTSQGKAVHKLIRR